jgi:hypothetical protein
MRKIRVGGAEKLVELGFYGCRPAWSPTGERILCAFTPNMQAETLLIAPDGRTTRKLPFIARPVAWSHDGAYIYAIAPAAQLDGESVIQYPLARLDWKTGVLTVAVAASDGDIWILDNFEPPKGFWEGLWPWKR